jgi:hypothetical protein
MKTSGAMLWNNRWPLWKSHENLNRLCKKKWQFFNFKIGSTPSNLYYLVCGGDFRASLSYLYCYDRVYMTWNRTCNAYCGLYRQSYSGPYYPAPQADNSSELWGRLVKGWNYVVSFFSLWGRGMTLGACVDTLLCTKNSSEPISALRYTFTCRESCARIQEENLISV